SGGGAREEQRRDPDDMPRERAGRGRRVAQEERRDIVPKPPGALEQRPVQREVEALEPARQRSVWRERAGEREVSRDLGIGANDAEHVGGGRGPTVLDGFDLPGDLPPDR